MYFKPLLKLLPSLVLLSAALFFLQRVDDFISSPFFPLYDVLPYIAGAISLGLAAYFNRMKIFVMSLTLLVTYWLIKTFLQTALNNFESLSVYTLLSVALPLIMATLNILPERGIYNYKALLGLLLVPVLCLVALLITQYFPSFMVTMNGVFEIKPMQNYILSVPASICFVVAVLSGFYYLYKYNSENVAATLSVMIFAYVMLVFFSVPLISATMMSAAAMSLFLYSVTSSYHMAYKDDLTGLKARRSLNERLKNLTREYTIAMIDIDRFKRLNDTYGHDVGDHVLKMVAKQINMVKGGGVAYRYGGEEFCVIFSSKSVEQCLPELQQVKSRVEEYSLSLRDLEERPKSLKQGKPKRGQGKGRASVSVTVSIGVAERGGQAISAEDVVKSADKALYQAKKKGRNRIVMAG